MKTKRVETVACILLLSLSANDCFAARPDWQLLANPSAHLPNGTAQGPQPIATDEAQEAHSVSKDQISKQISAQSGDDDNSSDRDDDSSDGCNSVRRIECTRFGVRDGVVRWNKKAKYWDALFKPSSASHHASQLVLRYPPGKTDGKWELNAAWFSGSEGRGTVAIAYSRLERWRNKWSDPVEVSVESGRSAQNPVWLYLKESDTLHLMHTSQKGRDQGTSRVMQLTSLDGGRTWSKPKTIIEHSGTFLRNHPIQALDGSWLLPVYHTPKGLFDHKSQYSEVQRSTDEGKSWEPLAMMAPPPMALVQPSIVRLANNFLLSFFRDRRDGNIWRTLSKDDGRSWSHPSRTILPNPNKAVQAMMLQSGAIAILFDNQRGAKQPDHRKLSPMTIALSYDAGTTFPYAKDLEDDYDVLLEYAYPSMVQEPKGDIHLSYTFSSGGKTRTGIRYIRITEDWIKQPWDWKYDEKFTIGEYQPPDNPVVPTNSAGKWKGAWKKQAAKKWSGAGKGGQGKGAASGAGPQSWTAKPTWQAWWKSSAPQRQKSWAQNTASAAQHGTWAGKASQVSKPVQKPQWKADKPQWQKSVKSSPAKPWLSQQPTIAAGSQQAAKQKSQAWKGSWTSSAPSQSKQWAKSATAQKPQTATSQPQWQGVTKSKPAVKQMTAWQPPATKSWQAAQPPSRSGDAGDTKGWASSTGNSPTQPKQWAKSPAVQKPQAAASKAQWQGSNRSRPARPWSAQKPSPRTGEHAAKPYGQAWKTTDTGKWGGDPSNTKQATKWAQSPRKQPQPKAGQWKSPPAGRSTPAGGLQQKQPGSHTRSGTWKPGAPTQATWTKPSAGSPQYTGESPKNTVSPPTLPSWNTAKRASNTVPPSGHDTEGSARLEPQQSTAVVGTASAAASNDDHRSSSFASGMPMWVVVVASAATVVTVALAVTAGFVWRHHQQRQARECAQTV